MNRISEKNWTDKTVQNMVIETLVTYYVDLITVDWNHCYVEVAVTNPDADYRLEGRELWHKDKRLAQQNKQRSAIANELATV